MTLGILLRFAAIRGGDQGGRVPSPLDPPTLKLYPVLVCQGDASVYVRSILREEGSGNQCQTPVITHGASRRRECEWGWRRTCQVAGPGHAE